MLRAVPSGGSSSGASSGIAYRASKIANVQGNAGILDAMNADKDLWHLWCFGDSRSEGIIGSRYMAQIPSQVPAGGWVVYSNVNAVTGFSCATQTKATDSIPTSAYFSFAADPICYREFKTAAATTPSTNALAVRLSFGQGPQGSAIFSRLQARASRLKAIMRRQNGAWSSALTSPKGTSMANLYLQARPNAQTEFTDPNVYRSAFLPIYNADVADYTCGGVSIPAGLDWSTLDYDLGYICEPGIVQTTANKLACGSDPWVELPSGILMHDVGCVAGRSSTGLLTEEVVPTTTFSHAMQAAGGKHALWLEIGTNDSKTTAQFESDLMQIIEKFRVGAPNGPVILMTAYAASGDPATPNYVAAQRDIVNRDPNIVTIDTYAQMPNYTTGNGLGYYADAVHYNATGQIALANAYWQLWRNA